MRIDSAVELDVSATKVTLAETCHTDSLPLLCDLFVRDAELEISSGAFALACCLLLARYIGVDCQFVGTTIGAAYARAIQVACPQIETLGPVNGFDRAHSLNDLDVECFPARLAGLGARPTDGLPLVSLGWVSDTLNPVTRRSDDFRLGRFFTNFGLVADESMVSIAIALMYAGPRLRRIIAPRPVPSSSVIFERARRGLHEVGIALVDASAFAAET